MAPPHGYRKPSVLDSIWSSPGAYGRIRIIIYCILYILILIIQPTVKEPIYKVGYATETADCIVAHRVL
jgi:hypothetical protein